MDIKKIKSIIKVKAINPVTDCRFFRANAVLYLSTLTMTVLLFAICRFRHGRFFTGIDYSGQGVLGRIGLWFTCVWLSAIISILGLWSIGKNPLKKPRWKYLPLCVAFLVSFVSGLSRLTPNPMVGEILVGSVAAVLTYWTLFSGTKKNTKNENCQN